MSDEAKVDVATAVEQAHCALINLDNMVRMMPALKMHPLLHITREQLESAVRALGREP